MGLEQAGEQRNERCADEDNTAAGHELLDALGLCAGVVISIIFHEIDNTPNAKTGSDCDYESLKNGYCLTKKCHICFTIHYIL